MSRDQRLRPPGVGLRPVFNLVPRPQHLRTCWRPAHGHVRESRDGEASEWQMQSVPSRRLHVTDKIQVRGVSTEEELMEEFGGEGLSTQSHVLLCSSCQGRGAVWVKGMIVSSEGSRGEWTDTHVFGMWRDDGAIELLHV